MIVVSGRIYVKPSQRNAFLVSARGAVALARGAPGCFDFVVAADPLESDRINVYEEWQSESKLEAFRGAGPDSDLVSLILRAEVLRHHIVSSGPA